MTISSETFRKSYTTQGLAGETFPTTFKFDKAADLDVILDGAIQVLGTNYSVTGGDGETGSVVFIGTPTAAKTLEIIGRGPATQTHNYIENDAFPAETHEKNLDRLAMAIRSALLRSITDHRVFDAGGDRISNSADPVNPTDLVNKRFAEGLSTPSITIPTPADPADDDKVATALSGAYSLILPPFKKTDLPLAGDVGKVATGTGAGTFNWQTPAAIGNLTTRNFLINGDFQINQRKGEGGTYDSTTPFSNADTNYVLDRWKILSEVAADGVDVTHEQTIIPQGGTGAIKLEVETAGAPNNKFGIIEYLSSEQTKQLLKDGTSSKISLSFQARTTTGAVIDNIRAAILAWTGAVDTLDNDAVTAWNAAGADPTFGGSFTVENTPANLAVGVDAYGSHSVLDVAMDTVGTVNVAIFIWVDDVINAISDVIYISDILLEIGAVATQFPRRDLGDELRLCARYAYAPRASAAGEPFGAGFAESATRSNTIVRFPVPMRATPTIALATNQRLRHEATTTVVTGFGAQALNSEMATVIADVGAGLTIGNGVILESGASGEVFSFDAEL